MRKLTPFVLVVFVLSGCSLWQGSIRPTVNLRIDAPLPYTVQAWGYPASNHNPEAAVYNSLSINLRAAAPFHFRFPDGFVANSKEIDTSTLSIHLAPITKNDKGTAVSRVSSVSKQSNYSIVFDVGQDGIVNNLSLYSCKHTMHNVLGTVDGARVFDFPLKQSEIISLFSGPVRIGHDFVILGYDCD